MIHEMKLRSEYFELIKRGEKIYEGRLNDEKRQLIGVGDVIIFKKEPELADCFSAKVKDLLYFKSFGAMLNALPLNELGFKNQTLKEAEAIYHQFYSVDNENKYGVVAIKVEVLE